MIYFCVDALTISTFLSVSRVMVCFSTCLSLFTCLSFSVCLSLHVYLSLSVCLFVSFNSCLSLFLFPSVFLSLYIYLYKFSRTAVALLLFNHQLALLSHHPLVLCCIASTLLVGMWIWRQASRFKCDLNVRVIFYWMHACVLSVYCAVAIMV